MFRMLYLFHGENITDSRNKYVSQTNRLKEQLPLAETVTLDGLSLTPEYLTQVFQAPSMLGSGRIVLIDSVLSRRPSKAKDGLISLIADESVSPESHIVLWEPRTIPTGVLKKLPAVKALESKLSNSMFAFLDALSPGNRAKLSDLLAATLSSEPPELVMFMLVRRVTQLLLIAGGEQRALGALPPWQQSQLSRQAALWSVGQLVEFHQRLFVIDEAVKTGATVSDLATHLDIALASL